jgi:hypothetical protein
MLVSTRRRRLRLANTMSESSRRPIDDPEELRALGEMLVDLNEADRLLTRIHKQAIALGDDDIVHLLDSELFWKLRAAGDHLREHFDMERSHGGHM